MQYRSLVVHISALCTLQLYSTSTCTCIPVCACLCHVSTHPHVLFMYSVHYVHCK